MSEFVSTELHPEGAEEGFRRKYGLDWPKAMSDVQIELSCAKKWNEELFKTVGNLDDPWVHLLRACRELFPPKCVCPFTIHRWSEEHAHDWTSRWFNITWGAASTSKSNDYGLFALLDWGTDPHQTYTVIASTSKAMLQVRSYESVLRYYQYLRALRIGWPGKRSKARLAIINESDSDEDDPLASVKASIKGVAVQDGSEEESRANLQGGHLPYVRMIGDELSQMRPAFMAARVNLMAGTRDFRLHGLCNPDDFNDQAAQFSVPVGGWASVDEEKIEWQTQYGWVRHHNGFYSPAITDPDGASKFPFLINQQQIDLMIKNCGGDADHPQVWTMVRGFPPPQGVSRTVISQKMFQVYKMSEPATWKSQQIVVGFLDPAYTGEGDTCMFQPARIGYSMEDLLTILFLEQVQFKIQASSKLLVTDQITGQLKEQMEQHGIQGQHIGIDDSGIQNIGDATDKALNIRCFRMQNNAKASELPVSAFDSMTARERYRDQITEAYYSLRLFAEAMQIRGITPGAAADIWNRRVKDTKRPYRIESKGDFKTRHQHSPDAGDAAVGVVQLVRYRLGFYPGARAFVNRIEGELPTAQNSVGANPAVAYNLDGANRAHYEHADGESAGGYVDGDF